MTNAAQVTALFQTTRFGVEIETFGANRRAVANAIQSVVGGSVVFEGGGYDVWTCIAPDGRKWKAMSDGSIPQNADGSRGGAEVVTPILTMADMENLQAIVRALRVAGSHVNQQCGIHVHVDAAGLDGRAIARLASNVFAYEQLIVEALAVRSGAVSHFAKGLSEAQAKALSKATTIEEARIAWYGSTYAANAARTEHYNNTRYHGLNLHSVWYRGTVEFRWFNASLHAGEVRASVMLALGLVINAKVGTKARAAKRAKLRFNDKKWTMYRLCQSLRLVGKDNASVREHLTKRLAGRTTYGGQHYHAGVLHATRPMRPAAAHEEGEATDVGIERPAI
jgi:hypothetical protein